jgi:hypothetical protein
MHVNIVNNDADPVVHTVEVGGSPMRKMVRVPEGRCMV